MSLGHGDIHIDSYLSGVGMDYTPSGHIAPLISPVVTVDHKSDNFPVYGRENFKIYETARGPKSRANLMEWSVSSLQYLAINHALRHEEPLQNLANADAAIMLRETNTFRLLDGMSQAWENRIALTVTSTSNVGSSVTLVASTQFDNYTDSDPLNEFEIGKDAVRSTTGKKANTGIIGYAVWTKLKRHPDILNKLFPHGGGGFATEQAFADLVGLDRILVGEAIKNTGGDGLADSFSDIWGKHVFIGHIAPRPGPRVASYMYTFRWTPGNFPSPLAVERRQDDAIKCEIIETHMFQDEKVTATELGYLMVDAVG